MDKPDFLITAQPATLFPVLSDTNRERRVTSIFLAVLCHVPDFAAVVLESVGIRVGVRSKLHSFSEVVFRQDPAGHNRPDGLLTVTQGKSVWSALIETKIRGSAIDDEQVKRYVELARHNAIDAVITISNQFVARADHSPAAVPKRLLRKTDLYHWSWSWLATQCEILGLQKAVEDHEQIFLLEQFSSFLAHPATGVERFTKMPATWKDVVQDVTNGTKLKKSSPDVEQAVASWFAEIRDLSLHLSSNVGEQVSAKIERKYASDPAARLKSGIDQLVHEEVLTAALQVPNAASDMKIEAALGTRTIAVGMRVKARLDRKSTKARLNWLLNMIDSDDDRLHVRARWPGRTPPTMKPIKELQLDPTAIQTDNSSALPHSFEVVMIERTGKRFPGRRTFIEDVERIVPAFYELVGVGLRAWQPTPPKPRKAKDEAVEVSEEEPADIAGRTETVIEN